MVQPQADPHQVLRFAEFELDVARRELRRAGRLLELDAKPFDVLRCLIVEREHVVSNEDLRRTCWPGEFVTESSVHTAMLKIRRVLGNQEDGTPWIETLRGRGYRFLGEVSVCPSPVWTAPELPAAQAAAIHWTSHIRSSHPFVGRGVEIRKLAGALERARSGAGGNLLLIAGAPGIGKSRTLAELRNLAKHAGIRVLAGRSEERDRSASYAPLLQAVRTYAETAGRAALEVGPAVAACLSRMLPEIRGLLPEFVEPARLAPERERYLQNEALAQLIVALARRDPLLLTLDDLHWADDGTLAVLRQLAPLLPSERVLIVAAYRDVEVGSDHSLTPVLQALRREVEYERLDLVGMTSGEVALLLSVLAAGELPARIVESVEKVAGGNPYFVREVIIHLLEQGTLLPRDDGPWSAALDDGEIEIPRSVHEVIQLRVSRLSPGARALLATASAFRAEFSFEWIARAAGLSESEALDALDEALLAQLVRAVEPSGAHEFTHATIRDSLYGSQSTPRRNRLHRALADAIEQLSAERAEDHAEELAYHLHRSGDRTVASRGLRYARLAADRAAGRAAWDQLVAYLRIASDLLTHDDPRRAAILVRTAEALIWTLQGDSAEQVALEASRHLDASTAADTLARLARSLFLTGFRPQAWRVAQRGARLLQSSRRDRTWVILHTLDLHSRRGFDPDHIGFVVESPALLEIEQVVASLPPRDRTHVTYVEGLVPNRSHHRAIVEAGEPNNILWLGGCGFRRQLGLVEIQRNEYASRGNLPGVAMTLISMACGHIALGQFDNARAAAQTAGQITARLHRTATAVHSLGYVQDMLHHLSGAAIDAPESRALDDHWLPLLEDPSHLYLGGPARATLAFLAAQRGEDTRAMEFLESALPAMEHGAAGIASGEPNLYFMAVGALHHLDRREHADVIERNLLAKWLVSDIRYPDCEPRLALARLCAVQRKMDEALRWFAEARALYDAEEWSSLRALCDYDEAVSLARAGAGSRARIESLADAAERRMTRIGMHGWLKRVAQLRALRSI